MQTVDFTSLYNHHEREVFAAVMQEAPRFPAIEADDCSATWPAWR